MKTRFSYQLGAFGVTALLLGAAAPAFAYTGADLAPQAKITIDQARVIALKAQPGQVTDQELERESGGSGLRYSFDIKTSQGTQEVGIDAANGKVLEDSKEGSNPD
jgi:uncharacterized membrane protein YkoI